HGAQVLQGFRAAVRGNGGLGAQPEPGLGTAPYEQRVVAQGQAGARPGRVSRLAPEARRRMEADQTARRDGADRRVEGPGRNLPEWPAADGRSEEDPRRLAGSQMILEIVAGILAAALLLGCIFGGPILLRRNHETMLRTLGLEGVTVVPGSGALSALRIERPKWKAEVAFEPPPVGGGRPGHLRYLAEF